MNEPNQSGRVLGGRYTVHARLGAGGWGSVYAATQNDLGRPVAIKVLHTSVALSTEGLTRFEREARAAAAIGHPNIAQVSDFQVNPGEPPFLVMEMLTGQTLGAVIHASPGRRLPAPRVAWIAYQMLAGLDVAHRAGIVHRDIKPDNVFLVSMPGVEDHVKLLDFGIAKLAGDIDASLTAQGTVLGSPAFMAPEQITQMPLDHRVDLYAVGATMYVALAGRMPFDATSVHALMMAITQERLRPLHEIDPAIGIGLSNVVARAMHRDRDGRFPSAEAMRQALEPFLTNSRAVSSGPPILSPMALPTLTPAFTAPSPQAPPPPMMPVAPASKGSGAIIALLVVVVVLLLLVVGGGVAGYFMFKQTAAPVASASAVPTSVAIAPPPSASSSPSTTASAVTPAPPAKGKPAVIVADAAAPPAPTTPTKPGVPGGKEFGGTTMRLSGGVFGGYDIQSSMAAVNRLAGPMNACYAATEFDPPDHQFTNWTLTVDPAGNVTNARRTTDFEPHPKLDGCLIPLLRQVKFAAKPGGGTIQLAINSRTKDNP